METYDCRFTLTDVYCPYCHLFFFTISLFDIIDTNLTLGLFYFLVFSFTSCGLVIAGHYVTAGLLPLLSQSQVPQQVTVYFALK